MGEQTLAAARLAAAGGAPAAEGEWLYADLVGRFMVTMPMPIGYRAARRWCSSSCCRHELAAARASAGRCWP